MSLLIPALNIMGVFQRTIQYNNIRYLILDQLSVIDSLIPMTKEEEEKYKQNPSSMNALLISAKLQLESKYIPTNYTASDKNLNNNKTIDLADMSVREDIVKSSQPNEEITQSNQLTTEEQISQLEDLKSSVLNEKIMDKMEQEQNNSTLVKRLKNKRNG